MAKLNQHSSQTLSYAKALLELANEANQAEDSGAELGELAEIVRGNPTFRAYLADPGISIAQRQQTLRKVFHGKLSPLLWNFLGVLNHNGAMRLLPQIADAYDDLLDEQLGKVEVDVTVAQKLSPQELEQVRKKVSEALKKDAVVHQYVDESILGGLVLRVQDKLIDSSVKHQLAAMREKMLRARPATSN